MNQKIRLIIGSFALILCGLLFAIAVVELTGRTFPKLLPEFVANRRGLARLERYSAKLFTQHPYLGTICRPGADVFLEGHPDYRYHVKTVGFGDGQVGFRDDGIKGKCFAVVLGDSFAFSTGVEAENDWVELLEKRTGKDFVNLGGSAQCIKQHEYNLKHYGLGLKPKIVIVQLFINDFLDAVLSDSPPANPPKPGISKQAVGWLWEHSIFFSLCRMLDVPMREKIGNQFPIKQGNIDFIMNASSVDLYLKMDEEKWKKGIQLHYKYFADIQQEAKNDSIQILAVIVPMKEQVYSRLLSRVYKTDYDIFRAQKEFARILDNCGIPYIDLTRAFTDKANEGKQLYFRTDAHWNEEGNKLCAYEVYKFLKRKGSI